jgi:hypothetical protein
VFVRRYLLFAQKITKSVNKKYIANRSVSVTKTPQLPFYWEGDAHIWFFLDAVVSGILQGL